MTGAQYFSRIYALLRGRSGLDDLNRPDQLDQTYSPRVAQGGGLQDMPDGAPSDGHFEGLPIYCSLLLLTVRSDIA